MKRLMVATKRCSKLTSNDSYIDGSWASGMKTADNAMDEEVEYCGASENVPQGFLSIYIIKVDKILASRVIYPSGEYSKSSW